MVGETVCVSVLRLWQAVCSGNGEPGSSLLVLVNMLSVDAALGAQE